MGNTLVDIDAIDSKHQATVGAQPSEGKQTLPK